MKIKHPHKWFLGLALLVLLVSAGAALAMGSSTYDLKWTVLSGGGGERGSQNYRLNDTLGQGGFGGSSTQNNQVDPGFWAGVPSDYRAYLPAITR